MARLTGKVAIVTGAGAGIGRGIARRFARFLCTDVGERDQVNAAVAAATDAWGRIEWQTTEEIESALRIGTLSTFWSITWRRKPCAR